MQFRDERADVVRGVGIVLVVIGHNAVFKQFPTLYEAVYAFHMPLFFFISGFFLKGGLSVQAVKNKFLHLIVPYFFVTALASVYYVSTGRPEPNLGYAVGALWATGHTIPWVPLWFLPAMFLAWLVASFVLQWVLRRNIAPSKYLTVALMIAAISDQVGFGKEVLGADGRPIGLPWSVDLLPIVVFYVLLGQVLYKRIASLAYSNRLAVPLALFLISIVFACVSYGVSTDFNYRRFLFFPFGVLAAVCGIGAVLFAGATLPSALSKVCAYLGRNSMAVFLYHSAVQAFAIRFLDSYSFPLLVVGALGLLLGILVPVLFSVLANRAFPKYSYVLGAGG